MASYQPIKPESNNVGLNAAREMRDVPCIGVFAVAVVFLLALIGCAFSEGSLNTLYFGTDYLGNVCGQGTPQGIGEPSITDNWSSYKYLWYVITPSTLGSGITAWPAVCVQSCPAPSNFVSTYVPNSPVWVLFNSSVTLNRCIPNFVGVPGAPSQSSVSSQIAGTNAQAFALLKSHFWIIPVALLISMILCGLWLLILQQFLVPIIFVTIGITFGALILLGGFFLHLAYSTDHATAQSSYDWYMAIGVILLISAFIFACVILYLRKDILVACDIIGEAGNVVKAVPTTMVVPIVSSIAVCLCVVLFTFVAINIYTVRDFDSTNVVVGSSSTSPAGGVTTTTASPTGSSPTLLQIKTVVSAKWAAWGQWYNIFMFLWMVGLIHAIAFMTIAFCGVFWYWSRPGSDKFVEEGVLKGLHLSVRYHIGTLIFGSLLLALVQLARIILNMLERRLNAYKEGAAPLRFLLCCAECLLACFERAVKFLNKNAYIVACMTGEGLFAAARHAMSLLLPRAGTVGAVSVIGEVILGVGKILIVAGVTVIGYFMLLSNDPDVTQGGKLFILFLVAVVAYFISSIFLNVFAVSIDVLLLSYCYDLSENNGADRPYFFPDSLSHHVQSSTQLAAEHHHASSSSSKQASSTNTTASGYSRIA